MHIKIKIRPYFCYRTDSYENVDCSRNLATNLTMKDIAEMLTYRSSGLSPSISRLKSALI